MTKLLDVRNSEMACIPRVNDDVITHFSLKLIGDQNYRIAMKDIWCSGYLMRNWYLFDVNVGS